QKTGPVRGRSSDAKLTTGVDWKPRSEVLVGRGGRLGHGVLGGLLGITHGLLTLALGLLDHAFALQAIGSGGFANALLGLAHCLVGRSLDLVCGRAHRGLLCVELCQVNAGDTKRFVELVWRCCDIFVKVALPQLKNIAMTGSHDHDHHGHTHDHGDERWKHDGVRVIPGNQLDPNVPSTPGMDRKAAINFARVGAQKLWAGTVTIKPDAKTGAHHHGHLESIIYVVKGKARMRWGVHLEFTAEANPGNFIFVPPYVPHQEINASPDEVLECVLVRSDGEAVAINLDIEPIEKPQTVLWVDPIHPDMTVK